MFISPNNFNKSKRKIDINIHEDSGFKIQDEIALTPKSFFKSQMEIKKQRIQTIRLAIETPVKTEVLE